MKRWMDQTTHKSTTYQKKKVFRHTKSKNVWMDKTTKTKSMSYPRLIKALNKDLDFYEESLDNIYPRLKKSL
ncbi:unnamed protein product [Brassica rapa subsp. trilocularis]